MRSELSRRVETVRKAAARAGILALAVLPLALLPTGAAAQEAVTPAKSCVKDALVRIESLGDGWHNVHSRGDCSEYYGGVWRTNRAGGEVVAIRTGRLPDGTVCRYNVHQAGEMYAGGLWGDPKCNGKGVNALQR
ncbi:hypothetical protein A2631_01205 [Candidatus Daviesbacteria bacterium RIFCSPHIGHO2_01_FULL_44_29]|uniref:Uncharacterized protein n=1 Tax=Candidatus Daviesbacteria bacterium RIFCSPHIGHO2_02_FULL_43_12 TaxID=1797776 RepID=A0A1F5KIN8_9BACT|nr:MAG: hypothetical protein A2631_01205 [Candidatus Daviesbacteria bacterium RIFCSPHIGHO2_01_FULL_44_29]OGE40355.1 MAG: hypothetical protein A3E86_01060 [Candidatus Daviesbacteria bacterium RIFCSPHIGHO2_12_FULL_47_45]OGE40709.1 MAG: hypothetical protein A3D25_05540 [Candidatus Daviesbacteria bacterium RIFCSPHIGHO2_02_FULL_43_12]OGE69794.1 MAG: hypothetical protein A3B55_05270 [Candidatus Daviesbacteria bacterium RIFCSPLOWO2_01_FULL_43_15]